MIDRRPRNQHFSLIAEKTLPIKSLKGFQKHLSIPTESNHSTREFVAGLAKIEIDQASDQLFEKAKTNLELKRRQIDVENVGAGVCVLAMPQFSAELSSYMPERVFDQVVLARRIYDFEDLNVIATDPFNLFAGRKQWKIRLDFSTSIQVPEVIDYFEEGESDGFELNYERSADWVELDFAASRREPCSVRFTEWHAEIGGAKLVQPRELISQYSFIGSEIVGSKGNRQPWDEAFAMVD